MKDKDVNESFKSIKPEFELGAVVYLKADTLQYPRVVIAFYVTPRELRYELRGVEEVGIYSDFEITAEKNIELQMEHEDD